MGIILPVKGLTVETARVFDKISKLECIRDLYLCGGTSISIQIQHRLSEDLDFELIGTRRERPGLSHARIIDEVSDSFPGTEKDILGDEHFQLFLPNRVKLSFFRPDNSVPVLSDGYIHNNIKTPSLQELLGMKIYATSVRNVFRDYYDIYCLLKAGMDFATGLKYALDFSRHKIHTKSVLSTLTAPQLFPKDKNFDEKLEPIFDISPEEICEAIKSNISATFRL